MPQHMCGGGTTVESALSFPSVGPGDQAQVVKLVARTFTHCAIMAFIPNAANNTKSDANCELLGEKCFISIGGENYAACSPDTNAQNNFHTVNYIDQ